jgi:hypothetical protein
MITEVMKNPAGRIIISLILGFGLAALFRQVCKGGECHVIKSPNLDEINKFFYKIEDDCYKYTPVAVNCKASASK